MRRLFVMAVAMAGISALTGCGEFKDHLRQADQRLQVAMGTAPPNADAADAAGEPPSPAPQQAAAPVPAPTPPPPRRVIAQADQEWSAGRFGRAVSRLRPLAEAGNPDAQFRIGLAHAQGRGVSRDALAALAWWHKAGIQGQAQAQYQLGLAYLEGGTVEVDPGLAAAWLARAAAAEHAPATWRLALLHEAEAQAHGDEARRRAALVLMERAAEQGHPQAQERIGIAYAEGQGVPRDPAWAVVWLGKAARQGMTTAQIRLAGALAVGDGVERDMVRAWAWYDIAGAADPRDAVGQALDVQERARASILSTTLAAQTAGGYEDAPTVRFVQDQLAGQGYAVGQADGLMGPRTRRGLMAWQRDAGLDADGRIGPRTLAFLRQSPDLAAAPLPDDP